LSETDSSVSLHIVSVSWRHGRNYTLQASSELGSDSAVVTLRVVAVVAPPSVTTSPPPLPTSASTTSSATSSTVTSQTAKSNRFRLKPATHHAREICTRNLREKFDASSSQFLAQKHYWPWPANYVARFVSRVGQFLCWHKIVFNCMQETCTRKNLYQIDGHTCKFLVPDNFLVQVS